MVKVNVPGINRVTAKGRVYYYHRATGKRLRSEYGTAAFLAERDRVIDTAAAPMKRKGPAKKARRR